MHHIRFFLALCCSLLSWSLTAQCPTVDEIRTDLADSSSVVSSYIRRVKQQCSTAADSLGPALYSRTLFFYGIDDLDQAITYGEMALRELEQAKISLQRGKMAYNLGLFHYYSGDSRGAIPYFRKASEIFPDIDHPQSQRRYLQALIDLGFNYRLLGDFQQGEEILLRAMRESRAADDLLREAFAAVKLGDLYARVGQLGAAAGALEVAIAGFEDQGEAEWLANTRISRLGVWQDQHRIEEAQREVKALLSERDKLDSWNLAQLYSIAALLSIDAKDATTAEAYFQDNLVLVRNLSRTEPQLSGQAWNIGGEVAMLNYDYDLAVERFSLAVRALTPGFSISDETLVPSVAQLERSPYKADLLIYLSDLAEAFGKAGKQEDALEALYAADAVVDQLQVGLGGEVSALLWREKALPVYEEAIRLSHELSQTETAFYFFEKSRAILLLEALAESDLREGLPATGAKLLATAENNLLHAQREILEGSSDSLRMRLDSARQAYLDIRQELTLNYPRAFPPATPEIIGLEKARENLRAVGFASQLHYFVGESRTYLFVLNATEAKTIDLGLTTEIERVVRPLLGYFTSAKAYDGNPKGYKRAANLAYSTLIAPAAPPPDGSLLLLPDGLLSYLPFAALMPNDDPERPYLLQRNPTAYAQSATLFARRVSPSGDRALAFTPFSESLPGQPEPPLPFSTDEARQLEASYSAELLQGPAATRSALLENAADFNIVHLATHAWAARDTTAPPRILTADKPLYVPDIYRLELNGALVTLSACRSNVGQLARGEGVLGLGRAFRAAGAGGVVASLWSINDRATADLTSRFYRRLAAGEAKPFALHHAQLDFLDREDLPTYLKSPYYWAGLTYYGDAGKMPRQGLPGWTWPLVGCLAVLVLLGILAWLRRK